MTAAGASEEAPGRKRVGVLISGRGSNMEALVRAAAAPDYPAEIVCVISNRPDAAGLRTAQAAGIATNALDHKAFATRPAFEEALTHALQDHGVELIALAGFMRLMTPAFVQRWHDQIINIHPSLLPAFKGLHVHQRMLDAGVMLAGCTVHVVRAAMDTGPIIAQGAVPVEAGDDAATLAARVLKVEHQLYPHALALYASGALRVEGDQIVWPQGADKVGDAATLDAATMLIAPPLPASPLEQRAQSAI
ncbi:MAG: phosphoribosylglycinamide formyltransferase [Pseudomonadota bacterium]